MSVAPALVSYTPTLAASEINDRALIIDTETTGRAVTAEIIEVAVCTLDGKIIFDSLSEAHGLGPARGCAHTQPQY
ncbi:MAG: hypothetical protein WKF84_22390 [Pyrinomonadaceae bacterium]